MGVVGVVGRGLCVQLGVRDRWSVRGFVCFVGEWGLLFGVLLSWVESCLRSIGFCHFLLEEMNDPWYEVNTQPDSHSRRQC